MNITTIENKMTEIFNNAMCTNDTLWYDNNTTLFEKISQMIEDEILKDNKKE